MCFKGRNNTVLVCEVSVETVCPQSLRVSLKQNNLEADLARIKNLEVNRSITLCYAEDRLSLQRKSENEAHKSCCILQEIICYRLIYEDSLYPNFA